MGCGAESKRSEQMQNTDEAVPPPENDDPLREALRRARRAQAERTDVIVDMRDAEIARLDVLRAEMTDALANLPADNDQFDIALSRGNRPRLWIDVLAFISMGRDRKTYRFVKDTREGRQVILESTDVDVIKERVLDYIAHRIIEREKALDAAAVFETAGTVEEETKQVIVERRSGFASITASFILGAAVGIAVLLADGFLSLPN